jgi:hypothetical protein
MYYDWVHSLDSMRLTSTYTFLVNGTIISWSSKNQKNVVFNWLDMKYMGCIQGDKKNLWPFSFFNDVGECKKL